MIIDTDKIRQYIHERDNIEHPGINWDNCSMGLLNRLEARAIKALNILGEVESLANDMEHAHDEAAADPCTCGTYENEDE
jgi:hypothetical protein